MIVDANRGVKFSAGAGYECDDIGIRRKRCGQRSERTYAELRVVMRVRRRVLRYAETVRCGIEGCVAAQPTAEPRL